MNRPLRIDQPLDCQVWVQGTVGERWRDWFDPLAVVTTEEDATCLQGILPDQAALLGQLQRLYSLGYPIMKVEVKHPG